MTPVPFDHDVWGIIAGRPSPFPRQCFYLQTGCSLLVPFVDGECQPAEAEAFRIHLATCNSCQVGLLQAMLLRERLS